MTQRLRILLGVGVVLLLLVGAYAVRRWRQEFTFKGPTYETPVVAETAPARVDLLPVVVGADRPTDIRFVPGGGMRAVIVQQGGQARLVDVGPALNGGAAADMRSAPLVLDLRVRAVAETGLLGLAFHPNYAANGKFYVYYTPWILNQGRSRIAEFTLPPDELGQRTATETRVLIDLDQENSVHQGGGLAFGPDGKLYVGFGDGGTANDPDGFAQNLASLKGKVLRLDVDGPELAPKDNPFVGREGARPEVWAYGLRNPWRISFDSTGNLVLGDVGQESREEVDLVVAGANMGWKMREGTICSQTTPNCDTDGMIDPIHDYDRSVGQCVTGGYQVTGSRVPELKDRYVFGDFVRGRIWSLRLPASAPKAGAPATDVSLELLGEWPKLFSTFGLDAAGDVYVADMATGEVLALQPRALAATP